MPLLTIIIPVYNVEKYLPKCLDSLLKQTIKNFEVILVDDGSIDSSGKICDAYSSTDKRFKSFHINNSGPSMARNFGLKQANGEYITFVDSDDWVSHNYVECILQSIENFDLLYFCHSEYHKDNTYTIYRRPLQMAHTKNEIEELILSLKNSSQRIEYCNFSVNKCFKKSIIDKYNIFFPNGLNTREDEIFTNKYLAHTESICFIPDNLYFYRITQSGLTARRKSQKQLFFLAKEMITSTSWQENELKLFSVKRIIYFFMEGASSELFPSFFLFKKIYNYYQPFKQKVNLINIYKLCYNYPFPISLVFFYIISTLIYLKRCIIG